MYKNTKFTILLPIILACAIITGIIIGSIIFDTTKPQEQRVSSRRIAPGSEKLNLLLSLINQKYVDTVNVDSLTEMIIPMFLEELDPHSTYIPAKDMQKANQSLESEFDGIGVMFNMSTDTVMVISVIGGGPSAKAGVMSGDRIITVNGETIAGVKMDQDSVVRRLRGPRGSDVELGIYRGSEELIPIKVTRDVIPVNSILASYMMEPEIGYIMFSKFSRSSFADLMTAVKELQKQGMKKLILDLRGNSGGYLDQAILISNMFLPKDKLIVYTQDRNGKQSRQHSDGSGTLQDMEMVMLIDESSASSSEILAGALQDNDRCYIVGRRSYGKGLVQEQIPFSDGSAVHLTIARYYTPSGRSIQKPYTDIESYQNELIDRYKHNEFFSADSIKFADTVKYHTVSGRTVYGGGGIMPDIFVPADTTFYTPYMSDISRRNILYKYTIEYSDKHRAELAKLKSIKEIDAFFAKDPELVSDFVKYAAAHGVAPNQSEINISMNLIKAQLKAYISRYTPLEENAFYYYYQDIDRTVKKALETIKSDKRP